MTRLIIAELKLCLIYIVCDGINFHCQFLCKMHCTVYTEDVFVYLSIDSDFLNQSIMNTEMK